MSALTDLFSALATKIRSKTGGSDTYTPPEMVDAIDDVYDAGVAAGTTPTQTKTVTAGTSNVTVTPDAGYALSQVTVQPTPSESKSATPSTTAQTITPSTGKLLSSVTVAAVSLTGDAGTGDVLSGKTFYKDSLTKQTGTMTNNGAVSQALNCGGSYTVPAGYHNGSGTVTANSLASQTGVDSGKTAIDASHVHSGYQGWVNGSKVSGTYTAPTITSITPTDSNSISMNSGSNYSPTINCYAVKSLSGMSPSNVSPWTLETNKVYKALNSGYAIASYQSKTPDTSGVAFDSGFVKMSQGGYAYSSRPSTGYTYGWNSATTAWTNSSPSSAFPPQTVSTSYTFSTYKFIRITYRFSTSVATTATAIFPKESYTNFTKLAIGANNGSGNTRVRTFQVSGSSIIFDSSFQTQSASQSSSSGYIIPTKIEVLY